jgi:5-methylcytosine-specific restriction endonuclease McrA
MLNTHALVLNRSYRPVHVTSVRRALTLLYQGVAKALDDQFQLYDFADWAALSAAGHDSISTVQRRLRVPRVVVLSTYDHLPKGRVRFSRVNIYARDRDTCQYCARTLPRGELNLDHVVPRAQGGRTNWENVVCSCVPCNLRKGGRTPEQAGLVLLNRPVRPRWTPLFRGAMRRVSYREWQPFLSFTDASYWNVELRDG